jgi:hypothetical protein
MVGNLIGAIEDAYFARQYGILGDAEWERMQIVDLHRKLTRDLH